MANTYRFIKIPVEDEAYFNYNINMALSPKEIETEVKQNENKYEKFMEEFKKVNAIRQKYELTYRRMLGQQREKKVNDLFQSIMMTEQSKDRVVLDLVINRIGRVIDNE